MMDRIAKPALVWVSLFIFLALQATQAHADWAVETLGSVLVEHSFLIEENGSPNYEHEGNFKLADGLGIAAEVRVGYDFGITLGLSFELGWKGQTPKRTQEDQTSASGQKYRFETNHGLIGPHLILPLSGAFRLIGEYYPYAHAWTTYSDRDAINPFRKGDEFTGKGYSAGIGFVAGKYAQSLLFRELWFNKIETTSGEHTLPGTLYQKFRIQEFVLQFGVSF